MSGSGIGAFVFYGFRSWILPFFPSKKHCFCKKKFIIRTWISDVFPHGIRRLGAFFPSENGMFSSLLSVGSECFRISKF